MHWAEARLGRNAPFEVEQVKQLALIAGLQTSICLCDGIGYLGICKRAPCAVRKRVRFQPQFSCRDSRIDPRLPPPFYFVTAAVHFAVVAATQGNGELGLKRR